MSELGTQKSYSYNAKTIPLQQLPESKKDDSWKKANMDAFERIGLNQRARNFSKFDSFYKMRDGVMDFNDYGGGSLTSEIRELRDEVGLSNDVMHYDFLGIVCNQIVGEGVRTRPEILVETVDKYSKNEYLAERGKQFNDNIIERVNKLLDYKLVEQGIELKDEFESEEEKQQYLQHLQEEKDKIISPFEIENNLSKNFKTAGAKWGKFVLERDELDYDMEQLYAKELESKFISGRWFRHYYIGHDYYAPEHWDPRDVFIDEDEYIEFPQDGEYVGRVINMPVSSVINRYGHRLTYNEQKKLTKLFQDTGYFGMNDPGTSDNGRGFMHNAIFGKDYIVPYAGYFEDEKRKQIEQMTDIPMGEYIFEDENNNEVKQEFYLGSRGMGIELSSKRTDIQPRIDTVRVTEAYWRGYEELGLLTYEDEDGDLVSTLQRGELIKEFIKDFNIKKVKNVSLSEAMTDPKPNTLVQTWVPVVYSGVKIAISPMVFGGEGGNIYLGCEPMETQLRAHSSVYNVQLPVVGHIGRSPVEKMRPYIIHHNIVLNQVRSLLEKETGMFLIFDFQYLPSEFKDNMNALDSLYTLYDAIREVGIVPVDTSKQNMQGTNPQMNTFMTQSLDFTGLIQNRMSMAQQYKSMALEQVGLNNQRIGVTQTNITAEGVKQGADATYAQTEGFYNEMDNSQRKAAVTHLHVAQMCQKNGKDFKNFYTNSFGEKEYLAVNDENLPLRLFDVVPVNNPKHKRDLLELKQTILSTNTLGNNVESLAEVMTSKSVQEIIEIGRRAQERTREAERERMDHEQMLKDKEIQAEQAKFEAELRSKKELQESSDNTKIEVANITAIGRMADKGAAEDKAYNRAAEARNQAIQNTTTQLNSKVLLERFELEKQKFEEKKRATRQQEVSNQMNYNERVVNRQQRERQLANK